MATATQRLTLVGELAVEAGPAGTTEYNGETYPEQGYRIVDVYLQNEGRWYTWMDTAIGGYDLNRDEAGWRVTCNLPWDHTYRLATNNEFTDQLPLANGEMLALAEDAQYRIMYDRDRGWQVYRY